MKKQKILISLIIFACILMVATIVNAADVTAEKIVSSTDGSISFLFSNLDLESDNEYEWSISKKSNETSDDWYSLNDLDVEKNEATVNVLVTNEKNLEILKSTNTAYISIRKKNETTNILNSYKVDLTVPLLKAYKYVYVLGENDDNVERIQGLYGITGKDISYIFQKIEDPDIVNNYIDNNHNLNNLKLAEEKDMPELNDSRWKNLIHTDAWGDTTDKIKKVLNLEDGLYYLWLTGKSDSVKTINGYAVIEIGTVTKINKEEPKQDTDKEDIKNDETSQTTQKNQTITAQKDQTTATYKTLPNTGIGMALIGSVILVIVGGIALLAKYHKYRDIK